MARITIILLVPVHLLVIGSDGVSIRHRICRRSISMLQLLCLLGLVVATLGLSTLSGLTAESPATFAPIGISES